MSLHISPDVPYDSNNLGTSTRAPEIKILSKYFKTHIKKVFSGRPTKREGLIPLDHLKEIQNLMKHKKINKKKLQVMFSTGTILIYRKRLWKFLLRIWKYYILKFKFDWFKKKKKILSILDHFQVITKLQKTIRSRGLGYPDLSGATTKKTLFWIYVFPYTYICVVL